MPLTEKYVSAVAGGGGTGTIGSPYTFAQMKAEINGGILGPGTRYNIKADGTYTLSSDEDMGGQNGTSTNPIVWRGYKTTPGDGYLGRTGGNGALITTNMPVLAPVNNFLGPPGYAILESINISGARGDTMFKLQQRSAMIGCVVSNSSTNSNALAIEVTEFCIAFECDFALTANGSTQYVMKTVAQGGKIDSCRIISASTTSGGIRSDWACTYYGLLIKGAGGVAGIHWTDNNRDSFIRNCTITGWADGIKNDFATQLPVWVCGNMITDNSGWGLNLTTGSCPLIIGPGRTRDNALGDCNNASGNWLQSGRIIPLVTTDTGGASTDYVNTATNDYNLIPTSPGKGVNRPTVSDMGPYGLPDPSGGGGTAVFHPLRNFIIRPA